jgi:bifunctional pyridoxal-dependent enzyme with beta-cystathionase and maltose regulon repressor activities
MGKTYRVFTIKCRPNDPLGTEKTWDVLHKLAELVQQKPAYPRLQLVKAEEVHRNGLSR